MTADDKRIEIFENTPVKKAVIKQIIPAIASQMIVLIYNLADTYFVGMLNDPVQTAALTIAYPSFLMLTAISNLFGIGGASALARALGRHEPHKAKQISAVSAWCGLVVSLLFPLLFLAIAKPVLTLSGADSSTYAAAFGYAKWVVVIGCPFTIMSNVLANLVRAEGNAARASLGISMGGILNIILDPFFVLPQFLDFGASGAGMATAISNAAATLYFLGYIRSNRRDTAVSVNPKNLRYTKDHLGGILSVGLPSALQYALSVVAVAAQAKFVSAYTTEAVAALGIIKKIDMLPLYVAIGVSSGLLPLLAYNHAANNPERRTKAFRFGITISLSFAVLCLIVYECFAETLVGLFIDDSVTIAYGAVFLRLMVTAMPLMSICYPMIIQFQAMGRVKESLISSILRKGVLDIPLLFIMDSAWPLYGCMLVQPIVDAVTLAAVLILYRRLQKKLFANC